MKRDGLLLELSYLNEMREIMAGPNLPQRKSPYDMEAAELDEFRIEVEEYEEYQRKLRNK